MVKYRKARLIVEFAAMHRQEMFLLLSCTDQADRNQEEIIANNISLHTENKIQSRAVVKDSLLLTSARSCNIVPQTPC